MTDAEFLEMQVYGYTAAHSRFTPDQPGPTAFGLVFNRATRRAIRFNHDHTKQADPRTWTQR